MKLDVIHSATQVEGSTALIRETGYGWSFRSEVIRGAALLDDLAPGWYRKLEIRELALSDASKCVLGQLAMNQFRKQIAEFKGVEVPCPCGDSDCTSESYEFDYSDLCRWIGNETGDSSWLEDAGEVRGAPQPAPATHGFNLYIDEMMERMEVPDVDECKRVAWEELTFEWAHLVKKRITDEKFGVRRAGLVEPRDEVAVMTEVPDMQPA